MLRAFLELDDPAQQVAFWREHLDTWRFRTGFDAMMSVTGLRAVYARQFLAFLPPRFGAVMRGRMERCFARHPNAHNPYARALLLGETEDRRRRRRAPPRASSSCSSDAASYLEACPAGSFDGFTLSNILDGAAPTYRERLFAAVRRAARPTPCVVLRSFGEPAGPMATNRAERRSARCSGASSTCGASPSCRSSRAPADPCHVPAARPAPRRLRSGQGWRGAQHRRDRARDGAGEAGERVLVFEWALAEAIGPWFGLSPVGIDPRDVAPA